ncbi:MAG TPA: hypothetical protein VLC46_11255 [Thermoanaerobaculia bacterium]|jgi:hypothetical protein|nr:hypothetical protein [Thermoanaerobaculia bacterium]
MKKDAAFGFIPRVWAEVIVALTYGLLLSTSFSSESPHPILRVFHDLGIGLVVAALVTVLWQVGEFRDFFERFARQVMIEDEYLNKLDDASLKDLRLQAARVILKRCVNNPQYKRDDLERAIDRLLYGSLLPGKKPHSGVYRENYKESVTLEYLTLDSALHEIGEKSDHLLAAERGAPILKVTTISTAKIVSPVLNSEPYRISLWGKAADLAHFPMDKRVRYFAGTNEQDGTERKITFKNHAFGGIEYEVKEPREVDFDNCECHVWIKLIEYRSPAREPFAVNLMSHLTRGLYLEIRRVGEGPDLVFEGDVIASGTKLEPVHLPYGIQITFEDWLFEDQGFIFWWWERDQATLTASSPNLESSETPPAV